MKAALGDAAWMAAMERNSDLVIMQCYAPLFANVNEPQWRPDLIGYDALHCYASPSYHAMRLFSRNIGDVILKASFNRDVSLQASVTRDSATGLIYVKIVNPQPAAVPLVIDIKGVGSLAAAAEVETLAAEPDATNSLAEPSKVVAVQSKIADAKPAFTYTVPGHSITVLKWHSR